MIAHSMISLILAGQLSNWLVKQKIIRTLLYYWLRTKQLHSNPKNSWSISSFPLSFGDGDGEREREILLGIARTIAGIGRRRIPTPSVTSGRCDWDQWKLGRSVGLWRTSFNDTCIISHVYVEKPGIIRPHTHTHTYMYIYIYMYYICIYTCIIYIYI